MRIVVHYPQLARQILLRTDVDWDHDVMPTFASDDEVHFDINIPGIFISCKPCLRVGADLHWARGSNYVLSAHEVDPDIWPHFLMEDQGSVSDILSFDRGSAQHAVRVYLPPGYAENTLRRYPVLYMQDERNLFFPQEAFGGHEWHVDETMDRLDQMNALRKAIVVGVAPVDRMNDYTSPGYVDYGAFLVEVIKPRINQLFRTRTRAQDTVVMGSSLGGVVSLYLAWQYPQVFGGAACLSSTFGFQDDLFTRIDSEPKPAILVYLDSGWPRDNFDATNAMRDLLLSRGFRLGVDLLQFSFPQGSHDEDSWSGRIHVPFQYFFGRVWAAMRG